LRQACQTASLWLGIMLLNNDDPVENVSYISGLKYFYLNCYDLGKPIFYEGKSENKVPYLIATK
jgi:hypothetical protein